jgi:hypothetical protein
MAGAGNGGGLIHHWQGFESQSRPWSDHLCLLKVFGKDMTQIIIHGFILNG